MTRKKKRSKAALCLAIGVLAAAFLFSHSVSFLILGIHRRMKKPFFDAKQEQAWQMANAAFFAIQPRFVHENGVTSLL